jgi:hypothetical protein
MHISFSILFKWQHWHYFYVPDTDFVREVVSLRQLFCILSRSFDIRAAAGKIAIH